MPGKKGATAPELTDEWFATADLYEAGKLIRPGGQPKKEAPTQAVGIPFDPGVVAHFRVRGPGWQ